MPIKFVCEHCGQRLNVSSKQAGLRAKCPKCKVQVDTLARTVSLVRHLGEGRLREEVVIRLRTRICTRRG